MLTIIKTWWLTGGMSIRILLINALTFLLITLASLSLTLGADFLAEFKGAYGLAAYADFGLMLRRPWAVLTHMFAHESPTHFAMNAMMLYWAGAMFQQQWGEKKLLQLYIFGGLAGLLIYTAALHSVPAWATMQNRPVLGASAAVLALFVATATATPNKKIAMPLLGAVELRWLAIAFVVLDLVYLGASEDPGGKVGHLGAALMGFVWAQLQLRTQNPGVRRAHRSDRSRTTMRVHRRSESDDDFNARRKQKLDRIDRILDKISSDGYDSLSKEQKSFLFKHGGGQ